MVCLTVLFFNNQKIFTVLLFYFYFQTFMVSVRGGGGGGRGDKILVFHTLKQSCFSHGEGSFKEPIHTQFYWKLVVKFQANGS